MSSSSIALRTLKARGPKALRLHTRCTRADHRTLSHCRKRCIATLKQLGGNRFFDKATILLEDYWAATPWRSRPNLLQAVEWLMVLGAGDARSAKATACRTVTAARAQSKS